MKAKPFPQDCSSETCKEVFKDVRSRYVSKDTTFRRPKGGPGWTVLEPAQIRFAGEPTSTRHRMTKHGLAIKFKRCYLYEYIDSKTRKKETRTCTEAAPTAYTIPQKTLDCYNNVSDFLEQRKRVAGGRPGLSNKVLAAVACRSATDQEPMTPALVAAVIGGNYNTNTYDQVRRAMETLVKSGKVKVAKPIRYKPTRLKYIGEEEHRMPKPYIKTFLNFIKGDMDERTFTGMRRLFGKEVIPSKMREMPEATIPRYWESGAKKYKAKKLGKAALTRFQRERDLWAARTGLAAQHVPIRKYRKTEEQKQIITLGSEPTAKMREHGFN